MFVYPCVTSSFNRSWTRCSELDIVWKRFLYPLLQCVDYQRTDKKLFSGIGCAQLKHCSNSGGNPSCHHQWVVIVISVVLLFQLYLTSIWPSGCNDANKTDWLIVLNSFHSWYTDLSWQGKAEQCNSQVSHHRPCRGREPCHRLGRGKSGRQRGTATDQMDKRGTLDQQDTDMHERGCRVLSTQPHIGPGDFQVTCSIEL